MSFEEWPWIEHNIHISSVNAKVPAIIAKQIWGDKEQEIASLKELAENRKESIDDGNYWMKKQREEIAELKNEIILHKQANEKLVESTVVLWELKCEKLEKQLAALESARAQEWQTAEDEIDVLHRQLKSAREVIGISLKALEFTEFDHAHAAARDWLENNPGVSE